MSQGVAHGGVPTPQGVLEERARELTCVEAAVLVLSPALDDQELFAYNAELERIHERIDAISALLTRETDGAAAERAAAEFTELGASLAFLLRDVLARVHEVDVARLRPAAAKLCATRRADVETLLDLCLRDLDLDRAWPLVDLLIGRLATGEKSGGREMARDPSNLTPGLRKACERARRMFGEGAAEASRVFLEALDEIDGAADLEALQPIIERVFEYKNSLGPRRLLPGVLRNSVLYNIAVANRVDVLADDDDSLVTLASIDVNLDALDAAPSLPSLPPRPAPRPAPEPEPERAPLTEHAGYAALLDALRIRLRSEKPKPGPAWRIAVGADLSLLQEPDREALLAECDALAAPAVQAMLVVGLAHGQRPSIDADLTELGIEPGEFEDEWVPEVRGELRAQIRQLILASRYDETRAPSEALTRLLPVWATSKAAQRKAARPVVAPRIATDLIDLRRTIDQHVQKKVRRPITARPLLALVMGLIAVVMVGRVVIGPLPTVHVLADEELAAISTHLVLAQRDQFGFGTSLLGKVDDAFGALDDETKYERAREITLRLRKKGVRNAVLSDSRKRMQVLISGGALHSPVEP